VESPQVGLYRLALVPMPTCLECLALEHHITILHISALTRSCSSTLPASLCLRALAAIARAARALQNLVSANIAASIRAKLIIA
jgi:hypothetical protein